jgi:hypothetical protein
MIAPIEQRIETRKTRRPIEIRVVVELHMPRGIVPMPNVSPAEFIFTPSSAPDIAPVVTVSDSLASSVISPEPSPPVSLVDLYKTNLEPNELLQNEVKTVRADVARIHRFQWWLEQRSKAPLLKQIADQKDILWDYARHLRTQDKGYSSASCGHALNSIMKMLRWCFEAGLIGKVPKSPTRGDVNMMRLANTDNSDFQGEPVTLDEFARLMRPEVLSGCQWPRIGDVSPAEFWECVLLSHFVFGFRSQDWFAARTNDKSGLLWSDILDETQCPKLDDLHNSHGWLWYLVHKTKKKSQRAAKPVKLLVPIPGRLRSLIERFRGLDPERVFPLTSNSRYWSREWTAILERAGLDDESRKAARKPVIYLSLGQKKVASFRKGCATMWSDHVDESAASYLLKHSVTEGAVSNITREHYLQAYRPLRAIVANLETLPIW